MAENSGKQIIYVKTIHQLCRYDSSCGADLNEWLTASGKLLAEINKSKFEFRVSI